MFIGEIGSDYANDDALVPPELPLDETVSYGVKCTKSDYYCGPKGDFSRCQRPLAECKCKGEPSKENNYQGCYSCLLVSCLKEKLGCKLGNGKPGKLCSVVGYNEMSSRLKTTPKM